MEFLGITLSAWSDLATIATAAIALAAYIDYQWEHIRRRRALETYLRGEHPGRRGPGDKGKRTVLHLASELGMTSEEVLRAAYGNSRIVRSVATDPVTGFASAQFFSYKRPGKLDETPPKEFLCKMD